MTDTYEEYVKPPSYTYSNDNDDPLFSKLSIRILQDLNQINGVYDNLITVAQEKKKKMIEKLDMEYKDIISTIDKQRKKDIDTYNEKAEFHIDNLISTIHNSQQKPTLSWFDKIFGGFL
jgi:iron uptake system EfeUOB component EfeO/EfeM